MVIVHHGRRTVRQSMAAGTALRMSRVMGPRDVCRLVARRTAVIVVGAISVASDAGAQAPTISAPKSMVLPNYDRVPIGQREGIEAGAFVARTNDAGAGWYNPAGLAQHDKTAVNASATAYEWTRLTLSGLGNTSDRAKLSSIGTYFGAVLGRPLLRSDKWRGGLAVTRPLVWSPSGLDAAFSPPAAGGDERFAYGSNVSLSSMIPSISVGYAPSGVGKSRVRLGLGLGLAHTGLTQTLSLRDRVTTPTSATVRLRGFSAEGSANNALVSGGLQWDASSRATLGVRVVSPGFHISGSTQMTLEASDFSGSAAGDVAFRDEAAKFEYKVPLEADAGIMFRFSDGEVEVNARYYASIDRYAMYESDSLARVTVVSGTAPPVVSSTPYVTTFNAAKSVTNVAIGGNYRMSRALRLHAGFISDASPVQSVDESIFAKADLYRVTSGLSFAGAGLSGSIGLAYAWGAGDRRRIGTTAAGLPAETRLEVQTFNLIYALSYSFGGTSGQ